MSLLISLIYAVPPIIALILSGVTRSRVATLLLRVSAVLCLVLFALSTLAAIDCTWSDFTFTSCNRLPDAFGGIMGVVQILYVLGYISGGPVVVVIAAVFEWWTRRSA